MSDHFPMLLADASSAAGRFDWLMLSLLLVTGAMAVLLAGLIIFFSIRYRKGSAADRTNPPSGARGLEAAWTIFPLLMFLGIFTWAAFDYAQLYRAPDDALPVFVVAKQWMWKVQHPNGRREIDELHVPLGEAVKLVMTSQDVIHSFFVPAFRVKQDVVPGRYTSLWFKATKLGTYHLFCAEYCGTDHAGMRGRVIVMPPDEYARWLQQGNTESGIAAQGFALFRKYGCSGCHSAGSSVHAPDLTGLLGRTVHLQDGRSLIADENYVRDSILLPKKDVVAGYAPVMPSFAGQVSEEDILALIEYLRQTGADHDDRQRP
ncbi:MAG TPA: cytochrome c oxidase subunit II [Oxalicibacterium sp.]|nr:cytochrome c oxidase subunit II [Oxalicibacterium sp.]